MGSSSRRTIWERIAIQLGIERGKRRLRGRAHGNVRLLVFIDLCRVHINVNNARSLCKRLQLACTGNSPAVTFQRRFLY